MKLAQVLSCLFVFMINANLDAISIVPKILEYNGYVDVFSQTSDISGNNLKDICIFLTNKFILTNKGAFLGCYQDGSPKDLANVGIGWSNQMTIELCAATCFQNNFKYAGLQNG